MELCPECGEFVESLDKQTGFCTNCSPSAKRVESWFVRNADAVEELMGQGFDFATAFVTVQDLNRPVCMSCGSTIRGRARNGNSQGGTHFCRKLPKCRTAARRVKYLREKKGLTKDAAIAQVIGAGT